MPRLLVDRFAPDTINQFRAAARIREEDALRLAGSGRGTAAVYLWGYAAEMTLKAAWFALIGYPDDKEILPKNLHSAVKTAQVAHQIQWPQKGRLHAVHHWALLLTRHRMTLGCGYSDPMFGAAVVDHSQRIYKRWRETLRYKRNEAYSFEIRTVAESTRWLVSHSLHL